LALANFPRVCLLFKILVRAATDLATQVDDVHIRNGLPIFPFFDSNAISATKPTVRVDLYQNPTIGIRIVVKYFAALYSDQEQQFFREIDALIALDHLCIVPFFGYTLQTDISGPKIAACFMSGGSLREVLACRPSWWTGTAKSIAVKGIVAGMSFMHELGIIHRDLKPSNILLDENRRPRICDFGSSRLLALTASKTGMCGTAPYMAPEVYEQDRDYTEKVDVFFFFANSLRNCCRSSRLFTDADSPSNCFKGREE
jgi:serine/threonine protein kinase